MSLVVVSRSWTDASHGHALAVEDAPVFGRQHAHLLIVEVDDLVGVAGQGGRIAGQEALAFAESEHQRAAQASADEQVGIVEAEGGNAIGALEQRQDALDGLGQIAVEMAGDQVGDDLGIGVAVEDDALLLQLGLEGGVVLDDAVVDDDDAAVAADVRMGVAVGRGAVGGPARVADADAAGGRLLRQVVGQVGDAAGLLADVQVRARSGSPRRRCHSRDTPAGAALRPGPAPLPDNRRNR